MPEHEQTLADLSYQAMPADAAAELRRWLAVQDVANEVIRERLAQIDQWGDQDLPLGFGGAEFRRLSDQYRRECDEATDRGEVTHQHVLREEVYEALSEADPAKARDELIQLAACAIKAIQQIDKDAARKAAG